MRKIKNYKLLDFSSGPRPFLDMSVPLGAILLKVAILHDGIYTWWSESDLTINLSTLRVVEDNPPVKNMEIHRFKIMGGNETIPDGFDYVDILTSIVELQDGSQGIMVYPIYKALLK